MTTPSPTPCRTCCDPSCAGEGLTYNTTTQAYDVQVVPGGGISLGPNGLSVTGSETVVQAGPGVDITGNGSGATPYVVSSAPSADAGNLISLGTDGNNYLNCASVVACPGVVQVVQAGPGVDVTGTGTAATPYVVSAAPSADAGNTIVLGSDGNVFAPATPTSLTAGPGVDITGTGAPATPYVIAAGPSTDVGNLLSLGADNNLTLVCDDVAACTQIDAGANVTVTGTGTTADPYVVAAAAGAATAITAGPGVDITGTGAPATPYVISSPPSADAGNVITAGADGNLFLDCADIAGCVVVQDNPASPELLVTGAGTVANPYVVTAAPVVTPRARVRTPADFIEPERVPGGTPVSMSVVTYDVGGMFNPAQPTRLTVPAGFAGVYSAGANVQFRADVTDTEGARAVLLRRNGAQFIAYEQVRNVVNIEDTTIVNISTDYDMAAGDYFEVYIQQLNNALNPLTIAAANDFSVVLWATFINR